MTPFYTPCPICHSLGKRASISNRTQLRYEKSLKRFEAGEIGAKKPKPLIPHVDYCPECLGSGLVPSQAFPERDQAFPHLAIIGGGIGGMALALACLHRGIPYTLYERDTSFDARAQGYGLTLQQASRALAGLGIPRFEKGITSIMHIVHDPKGKIIGEWGRRKINLEELQKQTKRRNVHLPRQVLRADLRNGLYHDTGVSWGHCFKHISQTPSGPYELEFDTSGMKKTYHADLVVGADGIYSSVRSRILGEEKTPLRYLGCIVILGICPLKKLPEHQLLDGETVFQTVDGHNRIYMMPYDTEHIMWQFSYPLSEIEAKTLSKTGAEALKQEVIKRLESWHSPIPEILLHTPTDWVTGYPVYDRAPITPESMKYVGNITLIGDAMHPMSPFKGQGANQAILDALELARDIYTKCGTGSHWREIGLRETLLADFESQMLGRSMVKVRDSAKQAELLHSAAVLHDGDIPRGRGIGYIER